MSEASSTFAWVRFLRNYGPIPTNDNMYDETIQRALRRHRIRPITLPAPLRDELVENCRGPSPVSYIITGTAGDGKTYHCREVWIELGGDANLWNQGDKVQRLALGDGRSLVVVKDLSELRDDESASLIADFSADIANPAAATSYLLAANHGQLLEKFKSAPKTPEIERASQVVEDLLVTGVTSDAGIRLELRDLSRTPAAQMIAAIIEAITEHEGWQGCGCSARSDGAICPIFENRRRLMGVGEEDPFKKRLAAIIELSERNGSHFPVRQLLALIANSLLGHPDARDGLMTCADVPGLQDAGHLDLASIYRNIFGENLKPSRAEKTELFRKLNAFGIGAETSNRVDNLLVYGADDPAYKADYDELVVSDPVYGATAAFTSAQRTYLEGADTNERAVFLGALRAQRQRLFFTMPESKIDEYDLWDLSVFRYAGLYLETAQKISAGQTAPRQAVSMIVRGLNRIFTGMLVQNQDELVLATSGSFSQSKRSPLLDEIISVPRASGEEVSIVPDKAGRNFGVSVKLVRGTEIPPVFLALSPTRFEFLGRVAEGALPSSFSLECHEDLLAFKARLLRETENRRKLDGDDVTADGELVLRFIDINSDGRAQPRRVIVRV